MTAVFMDMKKILLKRPHYAIACAGVLAFGSALIHPFGPKTNSARPLLSGADVDPAVVRILEKSCQNCHSERTEWPWYSYVAPMSWMIEKDVHEARSHMNLSQWDEYDAQKQHDLLAELAAVVRNRRMPLPRYTLLHPEAKPSPDEFERIYQWTRAERRRLTSLASAHSAAPADAGVAR
ncbi:MAG TPA: heme-binding domain-containing protein [Bryobacteraceae bacterium]|nr:heme-binding domain-containing protein [Bryobacteraceae bacterium]